MHRAIIKSQISEHVWTQAPSGGNVTRGRYVFVTQCFCPLFRLSISIYPITLEGISGPPTIFGHDPGM